MDEYFLQYLWKFQKFSTPRLCTSDGKSLTIFNPGFQNDDSGPDFQEAKLKIGDLTWSGSVEIHYRSSDWFNHHHHKDKVYENVVLHVVWKHDKEIPDNAGGYLPTLILSKYCIDDLEKEYRKYINQPQVILCKNKLPTLSSIQVLNMLDKAYAGRMKEKSDRVLNSYQQTENDWEETAYRILAKNFGFKINGEPFEKLARSLPYKLIRKHQNHPTQVEALIFGMAGMLEKPEDTYPKNLKNEFEFLSKKYKLTPLLSRFHWKFAKSRPANFPTVRLAQFASVLLNNRNLFNTLIAIKELKEAYRLFQAPLPEYWNDHYDFGKSTGKNYKIGQPSIENLIINSTVPLLVAYGRHLDDHTYLEKAESLLEKLPAEHNRYLKQWKLLEIIPENAKDSQALLFQYHQMCKARRCLECNIGLSVIGK